MVSRTVAGSMGLKADWALGEDNYKDEMDADLVKLSIMCQAVASDLVAAEPGAPTEGLVVILDETHATHPNAIAAYDEGAWKYYAPLEGWLCYDVASTVLRQFDGTSWVEFTSGGGGGGGGGSAVFLGAKVKKAADLNAQNLTAGPTAISWDTEVYDEGDWFAIGQPTRFTVPTGVTAVTIDAHVGVNSVDSNYFLLVYIYKNGAESGARHSSSIPAASRAVSLSFQDKCVAGDYYEVYAQMQTDTSVNILAAQTSFSISALATGGGAISAADSATVATAESRANVAYGDTATVGPSVTLDTGTEVIVTISARQIAAANCNSFIAVEVSGATTIAAADANSLEDSVFTGEYKNGSRTFKISGLTPGSNTFTLKYKSNNGNSVEFAKRDLTVLAL